MTDRRRHSRGVFSAPVDARIEVTNDALLEALHRDCAIVISQHPVSVGDEFVMEVSSSLRATSLSAKVLSCEPIVERASLRYRLRLSIESPAPSTADQHLPSFS
jgi:hypothetical protein